MKAEKWVQDLVIKHGSLTNDEDLEKGFQKICEPMIGDVVFYKNEDGFFQKIRIRSGNYLDSKYGRLSNFWHWVDIYESGAESIEEHKGYGNFYIKTEDE